MFCLLINIFLLFHKNILSTLLQISLSILMLLLAKKMLIVSNTWKP